MSDPDRPAKTRRATEGAAARADDVDPAVIDRAATGDAGAFTVMVRHYDARLRALAWRLLGDRAAMDDVLQEAYVKAFRALPGFRRGASPGTWLHRIVYNACIDELRRRGRRPTPTADDLATIAAPGPRTDALVAERARLQRALAGLPPDQRAAVLLVDAEGYDYAAAGQVLGVPAGTVASRLSRARAALRAALGDDGDRSG